MRKPYLKKWSNLENTSSLLLFAQALYEMLFHHTMDSFKAPALNVHSSLFELVHLSSLVASDKVKKGALTPIISELCYHLNNDVVISKALDQEIKVAIATLQNKDSTPRDIYKLSRALEKIISEFYWKSIKSSIVEEVNKSCNAKEIILLAQAFCTEAEIQGYSRSYIYNMVRLFFFIDKKNHPLIDSTDVIVDFLGFFDNKVRKWTAVYRASNNFLAYSKYAESYGMIISNEAPDIADCDNKRINEFVSMDGMPAYLYFNDEEACDPEAARTSCELMLGLFCDAASYHDHLIKLDYSDTCLIKDDGSKWICLSERPNPMLLGERIKKKTIDKDYERTNEILSGRHFPDQSMRAFGKALDMHRAALQSINPENQLLDLWAALEGFIPSSDGRLDRVVHYTNQILPSLTLSYNEKIFKYLAKSLYIAGKEVRSFVDEIDGFDCFFNKVVFLISTEDMTDKRSELYALLGSHPLLRNRCFSCSEAFHSNKSVLKMLKTHRMKVTWHFSRIYSTRNQIIHNADSLPYLSTLVENLHSYVDILLKEVSDVAVSSARMMTISDALEILIIQEKSYLNSLELGSRESCAKSNYHEIIFGNRKLSLDDLDIN